MLSIYAQKVLGLEFNFQKVPLSTLLEFVISVFKVKLWMEPESSMKSYKRVLPAFSSSLIIAIFLAQVTKSKGYPIKY